MAIHRHNSELLPERRDFFGSVIRSYGQNENGLRFRRGRKFVRVTKWRCSAWLFFLALVSLVYLSIFGIKLPFHGGQELGANISILDILEENPVEPLISVEHHLLPRNNHSTIEGFNYRSEFEVPQLPKSKHRKRYFPCEVGFAESVDNLVEPDDVLNFTKFAIGYISQEERHHGHEISEPRFGGHQTLQEREDSFHARSQTLHCGFVKGPEGSLNTGFDFQENDRVYMNNCRVVVSSCIFGSSDFLRRPTTKKMSEYSKRNVCFIMFVDEATIVKLSSEGHVSDDNGYIGLWKIVIVRNLPYTDMRKTGKVPKFLSHRLFPSARYSIWLDSKMRLNVDPMLILEYFLWRKHAEYAISNHYDRHCVWEEVLQNKRLNKYNHTAIDEQFWFYQSDGLLKFDASDESTPLPSYVPEGSFIVRAHTPMSNLFSCLWFNEVDRFTSRDQLSFAYTFLKLRRMNPGKPFFLNMFRDCERRAVAKLFHHRTDGIPPPADL